MVMTGYGKWRSTTTGRRYVIEAAREESGAILRNAFAQMLAEEEFQEPMDGREGCRPRQEDGDANSCPEARADNERSCARERFCLKRLNLEQAINTRGKILVIGAEGGVKKRQTRSCTHSRDTQECSRE
jgi:hypothetical protein